MYFQTLRDNSLPVSAFCSCMNLFLELQTNHKPQQKILHYSEVLNLNIQIALLSMLENPHEEFSPGVSAEFFEQHLLESNHPIQIFWFHDQLSNTARPVTTA
ncbi:uncharacterized protein [Gossypium hirsutum]|uniref:Uncharacterized protein n=1 Tax=Gossypium hirsutum TaxID=3635 RepID=A0A1U8IHC6_GOSHI|nr:uncharacterized protein LOC107896724 [Gossypium hirsutum]